MKLGWAHRGRWFRSYSRHWERGQFSADTVLARINLSALRDNLLRVAKSLAAADGLAVARLEEALLLRRSGIAQRILLLATLLGAADLSMCLEQHIDVTVHDESSVDLIASQARSTPLRTWFKLDSGMHRVGLNPDAFVNADRVLSSHPGILELIHMTHFSNAGEVNTLERQLACFARCHGMSSEAKVSLANSAALITRPETHADWVRPGIMLYGDNPHGAAHPVSLRPVMTLSAHMIAVRQV